MSSKRAVPALADGPLRFLPNALLEARHPVRAILVGWLTAAIPALLLAAAASDAMPNSEQPQFKIAGVADAIFKLVLFAPILESFIMAAVLAVLLRLLPPAFAIIVSSAAWAVLHALAVPAWGLVIWWPFLVFSTIYTVWRTRGFLVGVGMAATVHALNNLVPALAIAAAPMLATG